MKINRTTAVLYNDPGLVVRMLPALERAAGAGQVREMPPRLAADDFAAFSAAAPGFYWFLDASPHTDRMGAPNHSPLFAVDEKYLKTGVKAAVSVVLHYMQAAGDGQAAR